MNSEQSIGVAGDGPLATFLLTQQSLVMMVVIFGGMLLFLIAEQLWPRIETESVPVARWLTNWFLAFLNYFGALWHIHAIHHMDRELDVTTSSRHHFLEVLLTALLITPLFLAFRAPLWIAFGYPLVRILIAQFTHSNLRIPDTVDRLLRPFIVTPAFHRVHQSADPQLDNSNYGTVVPWFDYLFGTARLPAADSPTTVGLSYLSGKEDGRLDRILLLPFMWRHWKLPSDA